MKYTVSAHRHTHKQIKNAFLDQKIIPLDFQHKSPPVTLSFLSISLFAFFVIVTPSKAPSSTTSLVNFLSILSFPPHLPQEGSSGARDFNRRSRVVTNRCWASDVVGAQDEHRMGSQVTRAQVDGHLDDDVMTRIIVIVVAHM